MKKNKTINEEMQDSEDTFDNIINALQTYCHKNHLLLTVSPLSFGNNKFFSS